eukprot:Nk52_evm40s221 gene=Nk52_evmTU40s221
MYGGNLADGKTGYNWEGDIERTWDALQEDESGSLKTSVYELKEQYAKKRRLQNLASSNIRRGMMRHMYIVLDMSDAMEDADLRPTRFLCAMEILKKFVREYFDQNPISQLGLIVTKDGSAIKVQDLCGNTNDILQGVKNLKDTKGEPSLQNSLELARQSLRHMPSHTSKEVLVIFGSLTTCDPGNVHETIAALKADNILCSCIGLSAGVYVLQELCKVTGGFYNVAMGEKHFREIFFQHTTPPPASRQLDFQLLKMGFPKKLPATESSLCACHRKFRTGGYPCPRCLTKFCDIPVDCSTCGLTLVSAPHLARSFHHLFPLDEFRASSSKEEKVTTCISCHFPFEEVSGSNCFVCEKCKGVFCHNCNEFLHDSVHNCPVCVNQLAL